MIQIRRGVFETNSSSTHSISILPQEDFEKFKKGEIFRQDYPEKFLTKEEVIAFLKEKEPEANLENEDVFSDLANEYEFRTFDNYSGDYYETYEEHYTTKSGDKIVAFGYYGNN